VNDKYEPKVFRVMYRPVDGKWWNGSTEWGLHTGRTGNNLFNVLSAARGAVTQYKKRDRGAYEYKIQEADLNWSDVETKD
jgi:hypothetical protein